MAVVIVIIDIIVGIGAVLLSFIMSLMAVVAWARTIMFFSKHTSPLVWLLISALLLVPIGLSFVAAEIALHGRLTDPMLQADYLNFNTHPLWALTSLIGLILIIFPPESKRVVVSAVALASFLYLGILFSATSYLKTTFGPDPTGAQQLLFVLYVLGYFTNPFVTLAFFIVSVFRPGKKFSSYALTISLGVSVISTILVVAFPLRMD